MDKINEIHILAKKAVQTLKTDGPVRVIQKTSRYLSDKNNRNRKQKPGQTFADVLFINGCFLPHPARYRVAHQREQLFATDISSNEIDYTSLTLDLVRMYRVFIFFRCPYTEVIGAFIKEAKENHKTVLYDIDDLVIDKKYTESIQYLHTMTKQEQELYDQGLELNRRTLELCDGAVTTTERLAEELKKYVPNVLINRNVASEEMVKLSEQALLHQEKQKRLTQHKVRIGYFSGSATHRDDFQCILPVLIRLMKKYGHIVLVIAGDLEIPESLQIFGGRIETIPFSNWQKLPAMIADVDINLAPLEYSLFNEAKSENKWVEAALVKVPTVAGNVGAFARMIEHGVTGMLCSTQAEWEQCLTRLIEDKNLRMQIGNNAYLYCKRHCTSIYTAGTLADFIRSVQTPNIVFIIPVLQISGGLLVILKHCVLLKQAGYDVTIINQGEETDPYIVKDGVRIPVVNDNQIHIQAYLDKAVATLWSTFGLLEIYAKIGQRYYLVQGFETDFFQAGEWFRLAANRTYHSMMEMHYITISKWCQSWLKSKYEKHADYAPNGIDTKQFYPIRRDWTGRKIRILVEGNSGDAYKNVDESFRIVDLLEPDKYEIWYLSYLGKTKQGYRVDKFLHQIPYEDVPDIYRSCDILLKSSLLESFSYPPLEMMATGGYVVAAPNDGNREYLQHEQNCLFYEHTDLMTAVYAIERIAAEQSLRDRLYEQGIQTANIRDWACVKEEVLRLYQAERRSNNV